MSDTDTSAQPEFTGRSKMADTTDIIDVYKDQIKDLKRKNANLLDIRARDKSTIADLKEKLTTAQDDFKKVRDELDERINAQGDIDLLNKTMEEWEPIVEASQSKDDNISALTQELESVTRERDELKTNYENLTFTHNQTLERVALPPDEANSKYQDIRRKWERKEHEQAFISVLNGRQFKDEKNHPLGLNTQVEITDVWDRIGYVPEGETPEATQVIEQLKNARSKASFLFTLGEMPKNGEPSEGPIVQPTEPVPPGPGAGRGKPQSTSGVLTMPPGRLYNSQKVMDTAELNEVTEAITGKRLRTAPIQPPAPPKR